MRISRLCAALAGAGLTVLVLAGSGAAAAAPPEAPAQTQTAASAWAWPISGARAVLRRFVAPQTRYGAGHRGIDLAALPGTRVLAPADGSVHFSGTVVDRPLITIEHPGGLLSSFEPVSSRLHAGSAVHRGDVIGLVATGGHCSSECLHVGVRLNGEYLSPLTLLGGIPPPVLLPTRQRE